MAVNEAFTAHSHAYLFGIIAKLVIDRFGKDGVEAISAGVIQYGRQRGRRMAQRTRQDGLEPTALNYVAYGEWVAEPGDMDSAIVSKNPDLEFLIKKCPWHDVWTNNDLLEQYGYLYCQYVDVAIGEGYNSDIQFDIVACRGLGDSVCDMRMRKAQATESDEKELSERINRLANKAKMPWDYHCGHLFKTLWEVVVSRFGYAGLTLLQEALLEFNHAYGENAGETLLRLMSIDYNVAPAYAGIAG